jgi:hypothetical protein
VRESELLENEHRIGEAEFPDADRGLLDWHRQIEALMTRPNAGLLRVRLL